MILIRATAIGGCYSGVEGEGHATRRLGVVYMGPYDVNVAKILVDG